MADQRDVVAGERDMGGTMRLGLYPAVLQPGSVVAEAYGATTVSERHRHRYEVANEYRPALEQPRASHPYYVGTQAHPELRSRPTRAHPLFVGLIAAALTRQSGANEPVSLEVTDVSASVPVS